VFVLYMCAPLLLVAVAAAFSGDALASEATWGTLRYLLAAPVTRRRLLARKFGAAVLLAATATVLLVGTSLLVGAALFGWQPLDTPVGGQLAPDEGLQRVLLATAYVLVTLLPFLALALLFAVLLDSPLGSVGAAVGVAVVSQILDVIPTLDTARSLLPTHYALAWLDLFVDPPVPDELAAGVLQATVISVAACVLAWWRFSARDVTS
jgi:ABC-2 type transport system permease protein